MATQFVSRFSRSSEAFPPFCASLRYDGQACGVPGGKHREAWPPLQSLQDEPPPQMWEWRGTAAMHGKTGTMRDAEYQIETWHMVKSQQLHLWHLLMTRPTCYRAEAETSEQTEIAHLCSCSLPSSPCDRGISLTGMPQFPECIVRWEEEGQRRPRSCDWAEICRMCQEFFN